jgi:alpha-glucosidase (family GH31 glycosyl hydrolase)
VDAHKRTSTTNGAERTQVNLEYYPQWAELRARLGEAGVRVLTYMNPYLVDVAGRFPHRRNLFREAVEQGFLIKNGSGGWWAPVAFAGYWCGCGVLAGAPCRP